MKQKYEPASRRLLIAWGCVVAPNIAGSITAQTLHRTDGTILGNGLSMKAYRESTLPFPDGTIRPLHGNPGGSTPGIATWLR